VILSDDFERADGPLGDDYEVLVYLGNEIAEIQDGEVFLDAEFIAVRYIDPVNDETIRVTADLRYELVGNGVEWLEFAVVARYAEDPQGDFPSYGAFLDAAGDEFSLERTLVSGENGQVAVVDETSAAFTVQPYVVYRLELTVDGGLFSGHALDVGGGADDTLSLEDAAPLTEGIVGVHAHIPGDAVLYLDNVLIERYH
jgi:hypothetical protein